MSIKIVVDASCDLPDSLYPRYKLDIIPTQLMLNDVHMLDERDWNESDPYYDTKYLSGDGVDTGPASERTLVRRLQNAAEQQEQVLVIAPCRKRSDVFARVQACIKLLKDETSTKFKVIDSRSVFAGVSVLTSYAVALAAKTTDLNLIRRKADQLSEHIYCYLVPADIKHVRQRAQKRGDTMCFLAVCYPCEHD